GAHMDGTCTYAVTQADLDAGESIQATMGVSGDYTLGSTTVTGSASAAVAVSQIFDIALEPSNPTYSFSIADYGYGAQAPLTVTVHNTLSNLSAGTANITLDADSSAFALSTDTLSIPSGGSASFTVAPKVGLDARSNNAYNTHVFVDVRDASNGPILSTESIGVDFYVLNKSISGATITLAPDPYVYTGSAITPAVTSVEIDGLTVPSTDYDVSYANNINAGTATVTVTAKSNSTNFKDQASTTFQIDKAQADSIIWPTPSAVTYDPAQTLADIPLTGGSGDGTFSWADPTIKPTVGNSGYAVKFTPNDPDNYDYSSVALSRGVALTVTKADPPYTVPTGIAATYGDTLASVALPTGWAWDDTGVVGAVGNQTHKATFTPADANNYNSVTGVDVTVAVAPKPLTVTADNQSKAYGAPDPTLTWSAPGLLAGDVLTGSLTYTGSDVGTYDIVQATPFSNPNYDITFVKGTMTITQAQAAQDVIGAVGKLPKSVKGRADADQVAEATKAYDALPAKEKAQIPQDVKDALAAAQKQAAAVNHSDGVATVSGGVPWYVRLVVTAIPQVDLRYGEFLGKLSGKNLLSLYDIKLVNTLTGQDYEPPVGTTVTVSLGGQPLKGAQGLAIAHEKESGAMEYLAAHASGGSTVTFAASSFSLYGVTAVKAATAAAAVAPKPASPLALPATGDALSLFSLWVCLMAGAALVLARRRRYGTR
ncbi:MAG: hypothetical protein FWD65_08675, partial [Coriobacteriia bacterium]|nr:hypothetical protein [Coriobacteriia bacterium]